MALPIEPYFQRINYRGSTIATAETLIALHRQHVLTIPFENIDVHLERPILLDEDSLYRKIVLQNRGGYCYEMNGLFAIYLRQLGFKVSYLSARVLYNQPIAIPRMHMLLKVEFPDGTIWICDVGFGGNGLLEPIRLPMRLQTSLSNQAIGDFQLTSTDHGKYILKMYIINEWKELYEFTLEDFLSVDFKPYNYFQSNSPEGIFTNMLLCTIATETGRITLMGRTLKTRKNNVTSEYEIANFVDYAAELQQHFNIAINPSDLQNLVIKATKKRLF